MGVTSGCSKYGISHIEQQRKVIYINNLIIFIVFIIFHNVMVIIGVRMRTVAIGIQEFEKIRANHLFYVDKTEFIREWYQKQDDITLIARPRRFGKTLTMDMMNCFFSTAYAERRELFKGLAISQDEEMMKLQGTIPTISISFASVKPRTYKELLVTLTEEAARIYDQFSYLIKSGTLSVSEQKLYKRLCEKNQKLPDSDTDEGEYLAYVQRIINGYAWLSEWLFKYHKKKVLILFDEYDTPLQAAYLHHYYDDALWLIRELFSVSLKNNRYMGRAILTGITRIAKESLFSEMNNFSVCSMISGGYDDVFGFTGKEMDDILEEYQIQDKKEELRFWYDGFSIGKETGIYNPWSVVSFLARRMYQPEDYWAQSGGTGLVDLVVRRGDPSLHEAMQKLICGEETTVKLLDALIFSDLDNDDAAIWSLMVAAGYVKPIGQALDISSHEFTGQKGAFLYYNDGIKVFRISLTNHETRLSFLQMARRWFRRGTVDYMHSFAQALLLNDLPEMNKQMTEVVLLAVSSFDSGVKPSRGSVQPENYFHGLITGLLFCLSEFYTMTSNRESGEGRYDLCLEPIDRSQFREAYLIEFKVFDKRKGDRSLLDTAVRARKQIEDMEYDLDLIKKGFAREDIRKYGFGFRGKKVLIVS